MNALLLAVLCSAVPFARPDSTGPFAVSTFRVSIPRDHGTMTGIVYRPLPSGSDSVSRPAVVFGHGYLAAANRYDSICRRLASHGFYVVVPANPDPGFFSSLRPAADDMRAAVEFIDSLALMPEVHVDSRRIALAGHSMGGGAAFLDAQRDATGSVKAVIGLAPYRISNDVRPESLHAAALIIAGGNDRSARPDVVRRQFYAPCPSPSYFALVREGGHNGFLDLTSWIEDRFEPFDRVVQLKAVRALMTAFLKVYLDRDERYLPWLNDSNLTAALGAQMEYK
jgi:dienelactone hydrolase